MTGMPGGEINFVPGQFTTAPVTEVSLADALGEKYAVGAWLIGEVIQAHRLRWQEGGAQGGFVGLSEAMRESGAVRDLPQCLLAGRCSLALSFQAASGDVTETTVRLGCDSWRSTDESVVAAARERCSTHHRNVLGELGVRFEDVQAQVEGARAAITEAEETIQVHRENISSILGAA